MATILNGETEILCSFEVNNNADQLFVVIQDKTFGLKNKKGAKQQRFIQQVEKQVKSGGIPARKVDDKKKDDKTKDDLGLIFKPVQKVEKGKIISQWFVLY